MNSNKSIDKNLFIFIKDKYSPLNSFVFRLSEMKYCYPINNSGGTVVIKVEGLPELDPSISFDDFMSFIDYVINKSDQEKDKSLFYTIIINKDLSCEWS